MGRATVVFWRSDEGWGAIEDSERPGQGFVHFSAIQDMPGYRELTAGDDVEYEWDGYPNGQDGCEWRAAWVRRVAQA
jgi:cold shock protein